MTAEKSNDHDLAPTVFVLFGATGDLAKRMVLPAFYRLSLEGLLPRQWLLIGNGRGDVAHEDFRKHVHDVLTEFGPKPEPAQWKPFAERLWFAGGGFTTDSPGSLLDDLAKGRTSAGRGSAARTLPRDPAGGVRGDDQGARPARAGQGRPGGLREAVRHVASRRSGRWTRWSTRSWTSSRSTGSTTSWARRRPRTCTRCASRTACSPRCGTASTWSRCRSTCRRSSASPTGRCSTMLPARSWTCWSRTCTRWRPRSQWNRRPRLDAMDLQAAREKVISCFRPLDPSEVVLGQFTGLPRRARGGGEVEHGYLRGGPAVDRQPPLARRAVLPAHRQAAGADQAAGQPDPARARRARWPGSCPARPTCCRSPWPATARSTCR